MSFVSLPCRPLSALIAEHDMTSRSVTFPLSVGLKRPLFVCVGACLTIIFLREHVVLVFIAFLLCFCFFVLFFFYSLSMTRRV